MCFDYGIYKERVVALVPRTQRVDDPADAIAASPISGRRRCTCSRCSTARDPVLRADVLLLPIANATLEEFAAWFLARLSEDGEVLRAHRIDAIDGAGISGPGQSAGRRARFD